MKNRRNRPSAFLNIDLPDFIIETRGYISLGEGGQQIYVEEYKKRVESRIVAIVEKHPTLAAIREGQEITDEQLVEIGHLHRELSGDLQLNNCNIRKTYGLKVDNFLAFITTCSPGRAPDYSQVVERSFASTSRRTITMPTRSAFSGRCRKFSSKAPTGRKPIFTARSPSLAATRSKNFHSAEIRVVATFTENSPP